MSPCCSTFILCSKLLRLALNLWSFRGDDNWWRRCGQVGVGSRFLDTGPQERKRRGTATFLCLVRKTMYSQLVFSGWKSCLKTPSLLPSSHCPADLFSFIPFISFPPFLLPFLSAFLFSFSILPPSLFCLATWNFSTHTATFGLMWHARPGHASRCIIAYVNAYVNSYHKRCHKCQNYCQLINAIILHMKLIFHL